MNLYVVRHGQTLWNEEGKVQGTIDIPLSLSGEESIRELKPIVASLNIDEVISSPLIRAYETARIITDNKFKIEIDDRIKERDWGLNEGLNVNLVDRKKCWNIRINTNDNNIEPVVDFMNRVSSFIEDIKVKYKDKSVLVVTHSAVSRAIHYLLGNIPEDMDLSKINIPNLRIIEYKL